MGAHEFHGPAPSRHGRKLSKLGPGIIDAKRLDELLTEGGMKRGDKTDKAWLDYCERNGCDPVNDTVHTWPVSGPLCYCGGQSWGDPHDEGGEA